MSRLAWAAGMTLALCLGMAPHAAAQQQDAPLDLSGGGPGESAQAPLASVSWASKPGERVHFGHYTGGQHGTTLSAAMSVFF